MNKLIAFLFIAITIVSCKGPGSGPLVKESFEDKKENNPMTGQQHQVKPVIPKADIKIIPCESCTTIEKLMADKKSFSGKTIKVKGVVTRVNEEIMGKNWVHIQDGTRAGEEYDLTITTLQSAKIGDTVTFEGKISLDKDFGYGYFYNVLMEEGAIVK